VQTTVTVTTLLAVLLGLRMGYGAAGIGGAILFGALIGIGGALVGSLVARTIRLASHSWKFTLATAALVLLARITWNVYF
jgi:hypothetical protein